MTATRKSNAIGSVWLGALTWDEAEEALQRLPVIIPVGGAAVEHGPHLPYDTDRVIVTAIADAVADRAPVLVAPPIDYVYAPELMGSGGTISLGPESFMGLVGDVIRSLARHSARHISADRARTRVACPAQYPLPRATSGARYHRRDRDSGRRCPQPPLTHSRLPCG